jgi:hypothetical protein
VSSKLTVCFEQSLTQLLHSRAMALPTPWACAGLLSTKLPVLALSAPPKSEYAAVYTLFSFMYVP